MLRLELQYFGHLKRRVDSLEKTLMLGGIVGRRKRGWQRIRWLDGITDSMDVSLSEFLRWWWTGRSGVLWFMGSQRVGHDWATELNWTEYALTFSSMYFLTSPELTCSWPVLISYQLFLLTTSLLLYLPPRLPLIHLLSVGWFRQRHSVLPQYSMWSCFGLIMGLSGFPEIELRHIQIFCLMLTCQAQECTEVIETTSWLF